MLLQTIGGVAEQHTLRVVVAMVGGGDLGLGLLAGCFEWVIILFKVESDPEELYRCIYIIFLYIFIYDNVYIYYFSFICCFL